MVSHQRVAFFIRHANLLGKTLSGFFTGSDVRFFDHNQMVQAQDWLESGFYG